MRTRITLECTECKQRNYNMTKDKKAHPERMETKEILQILQITHTAQRNEVVVRREVDYEMRKEKTQKKELVQRTSGGVSKRLFGRIRKHLQDRRRQLSLFP